MRASGITAHRQSVRRAPRRRRMEPPQTPEPSEEGRPLRSAKDTNIVRGDDRPQAVRHPRN